MPITIDGTGSITGLSAGGLPDLSVATADIAAGAVTAPKLDGAQSGSAPIYAARAWVNFNGTGTVAIRASGNVSSITDNAVGNYTVNFATAMPDANYNVTGICDITSGSGSPRGVSLNASGTGGVTPTSAAFKIATGEEGTNFADVAYVCVSVYR
jgi:hypothetical protein